MAIQEVLVSKIFNYTSEPTKKIEGQFWFNPSTNVLSRYDGTTWKPISVSSDDVAVLSSGNKVSLTSYLNTQIAALAEGIDTKQDKLAFYSENSNNSGKYATIDTSADSGGESIVNINAYSPYEGSSEINLHTDNTYMDSLISLTAHSGQNGGGGNSKISLEAVNDEYDSNDPSQITNSYNSNIDVDCKSITLSSNTLSIKLDAYPQPITLPDHSLSTPPSGIYIDGELYGSSISTSIPVSNAVNTKVVSEKAVKIELDKKQNKLLYYSETSGDVPSATISVANISLGGSVAEGYSTTASGDYSHTEGGYTNASSDYQHVQGKYNIEDANNKYADIIGNGSADDSRSNAQTVSWTGITWSQTDVRAGGTDQDAATHSLAAKQNATDNNLTTIDKTIVGAINGLNTRIDNSSGMLYFTGGNNKYGSNSTFSAGEVFSVAYRTDFQFAEGSATANQYRSWSVGNPASSNISLIALSDDRLRISYNGGGFCSYKGSDIRAVIKTINDIVVIVTNPTGGNMNTSLYVNGVQIPQASYSAKPSLKMTGYRLNAFNYASSTIDTTMKDFAIFNFDMSAEGAPYSVADYSAGKPVPPSALAQTAVLLENYTFTVGSTQYIPDVSGNNHDITVASAGAVAGTFDKAIAKLASLIRSTNA